MGATFIHSSAVVHARAEIGQGAQVGPYCVVGGHVVVGDESHLHAHVVVEGHTVLGKGNEVFPFACLGGRTQDLKWKGGNSRTRIGDNNTFRESVTVHGGTGDGEVTVVGSGNHILACAHIAHNVVLGNHVVMSNVATLGGHVVVEDYAVIGGLAAVHQFCRIGAHAIVGGCSKVVQDVPPFMMADGNPARTRTINRVGLTRQGVSAETQAALKKAFRILFRDGLTIPNAVQRIRESLPAVPEIEHLLEFIERSDRGISR